MKTNLIYWNPSKNYAREGNLFKDEAEMNALSVNLVEGWWDSQPVAVVKMTPEEQEKAVKELEARWTLLKASEVEAKFEMNGQTVTVVPSERQLAFERTFTHNGKVVKPTHEAVYAFRRGAALLGALALRLKAKQPAIDDIPVNVKEFADEYDRMVECARENFGKLSNVSLVTTHWPTIIKLACECRDLSKKVKGVPVTEAETIRVISGGDQAKVKRGTGQKAYRIALLDYKFPALKIAENVIKGTVSATELDREELHKLIKNNASENEVLKYVSAPKDPNARGPIAIKKSELDKFAKQTPNLIIAAVIGAINGGDMKFLYACEDFAASSNGVYAPLLKKARADAILRIDGPQGEGLPEISNEDDDDEAEEEAPAPAVAASVK